MARNVFEDDAGAVFSDVIRESEGDVYVVNPTEDAIPEIVRRLHDAADSPSVRLLAGEDALKSVMADFVVAGHAADLLAADSLAIRVLGDAPESSLLVSGEVVVSLVAADDRVGGLTATDESFVAEALAEYADRWAAAEPFQLRTPPISRVRETLASDVGPAVAEDFDAILAELPAAKGDGEGLSEVTIAILAAARNGELLYDISRWGEDVELASKATFSRTKSQLEDSGVIGTEKVPIDVGRPRLRLRLGEDLRGVDVPELTALVRERLSGR